MLGWVRNFLLYAALAVGIAGGGYGLWQARKVSAILADLDKVKTALRASEGAQRALAGRLKLAEQRQKEDADRAAKDATALASVPEWASVPLPAAVRERLLDD